MSKSRVVSSVLCATILLTLATATMSFALNAVDSAGKVIGQVTSSEFGAVKVLAKLKAVPYLITVGRDRISGTEFAYYAQADCGGAPYILMEPAERIPIIVFPSALGADGRIYIMARKKMSELGLLSYFDSFYQECVNFDDESPSWVTPLQPVGNLGATFKAPYSAK